MDSEIPTLSLGFSPCPNDTFIFNALVSGLVCGTGVRFSDPVLEDVETLNEWAIAERLDVTKLSFHALGHVLDKYVLLHAGSALGRGCGPLLVGCEEIDPKEIASKRIAIPGKFTTAAMLLKIFDPSCANLVPMRFDMIMPAVVSGEVEAGLIIHESRFTYQGFGLKEIMDLGRWWEDTTGLPIPLGGIAARRSLGYDLIKNIESCISESVKIGFADPDRARDYIRNHAQEMDDAVIDQHISLYVNDFSINLAEEGEAAVKRFFDLAGSFGLFPDISEGLSIFLE